MGVAEDSDEYGCEGPVGFWEEDSVVCENECHVVLEHNCLNKIGTVTATGLEPTTT